MTGPRLTSVRLRGRGDRSLDATVVPDPAAAGGRVLRLRTGVVDVDLDDREVVRLLALLAGHYALPADGVPDGRAARMTLDVLLEGPPAEGGRRIAEAGRLVGLALGRMADGEAKGLVADERGERRVAWELRLRGAGRGRVGMAGD